MRLGLLVLAIAAAACCGARGPRALAPGESAPYLVLRDNLPAETLLCVHRTLFDAAVVCVTLREFRASVRGRQLAAAVIP